MNNNKTIDTQLHNSWLLIDTNVLFKASKNYELFYDLFKQLINLKCQLTFNELIKTEFLQSVWQPELINDQKKFLQKLNVKNVPISLQELSITRHLRARKRPLPELVDSYNIALIKKYSPNLKLLTSNHRDFGYSLKRFHVHPLEINPQEILTLGFYKT